MRHGNRFNLLYKNPRIMGSGGITVAAPVADFTTVSTTISAGDTLPLTDLSTNTPTSWAWTLHFVSGPGSPPDDQTSTVQNPSFVIPDAGVYTVTLVATNAGGSDSEIKSNYVTVNATFALTIPVAGTFTLTAAGNATGVTIACLGGGSNGQAGSIAAPGGGGVTGGYNQGDCTIGSGLASTVIVAPPGPGDGTSFQSVGDALIISATNEDGGDPGQPNDFTGFTNQVGKSGGLGGAAGVGGGGGGAEAPSASANGSAGSAGGVTLGGAGGTGGAGADGGAGGAVGNNVGLPGTGPGAGGGGGGLSGSNPAGGAGQPGQITISGTTAASGLPFNCTSADVSTQPLLIRSITSDGGLPEHCIITTVGPHGIASSGQAAVVGTSVGAYNVNHACTVNSTTTLLSNVEFVSTLGGSNTDTALTAVGSFTYAVGG